MLHSVAVCALYCCHMAPADLQSNSLPLQVDQYLRTKQPANLVPELVKRLVAPPGGEARPEAASINQSLINALVLYVGAQPKPGTSLSLQSPAMDLFQRLAAELDNEGRYILLNAIANQLRWALGLWILCWWPRAVTAGEGVLV
jgi:CCR4-NOT transcription complex subunit 1